VSKFDRFDDPKSYYEKFYPGPGQYKDSTSSVSPDKMNYRFRSLYASKDTKSLKVEKSKPGPGYYNPILPNLLQKEHPDKPNFFFVSQDVRLKGIFGKQDNKVPGPGKYFKHNFDYANTLDRTSYFFKQNVKSEDPLEKHLNISTVSASASADYDVEDHLSTSISVVLETQFDGTKIHLTEKICRALACGHPFILAAGPGSLRYLKTYGFETFSPWLDESYDTEVDSASRLEKIINSMKKFSALPQAQKTQTLEQINQIAQRNKQRFFSNDFYHCLSQELQTGLSEAFAKAVKTQATRWLGKRRRAKKLLKTNHGSRYAQLSDHVKIVRAARKNYALTMMPDQDSGKS
jgi:hypothetical protein